MSEKTKTNIYDPKRNLNFKRVAVRQSFKNSKRFNLVAETDDVVLEFDPRRRVILRYIFLTQTLDDNEKRMLDSFKILPDFGLDKHSKYDVAHLKHATADLFHVLRCF